MSLKRKLFLLINLLTIILLVIGIITNIIVEMSIWASAINLIAIFILSYFYYHCRFSASIDKFIIPLLIISFVLLGLGWITNGGYDSNITLLIFIFYLSFSSVLKPKLRILTLFLFLIFYTVLVTSQYYFPNIIIPYDNQFQRFIDMLFGGLVYFLFIFFINKMIINAYESDKGKLEEINIKLQSSEEKFRNLYDTMPVGYYKTTANGKFIDANPAFIKMLGYDNFEELNKIDILTDLYPNTTDRDSLLDHLNEFDNINEVYQLKRKDGGLIWVEDYPRYIKNDEGIIVYHEGLINNITERLEYESKILQNEKKLEELNRSKDKFFSIIAHDLKSPLSSVRDLSDILYTEYDNLTEEDKKEFLEALKNSTNNVYGLLENLLEWSRTQRNLISYNPTTEILDYIVGYIVNIYELQINNKSITIFNLCNLNTQIYTDVNLLYTVLRNVISNAIKFTPTKGTIEIGILEETENTSNYLTKDYHTIYIKDSGIGMSKENIDKVFRVDNSFTTLGTMGEKGTGLGLVLVKELIKINKGDIWIESIEGKGTTIFFTIPKRIL